MSDLQRTRDRPVGSDHATTALLLTCEHASRSVPRPYRRLFRGAEEILRSHRGWDPGALQMAQQLAQHFAAPLMTTKFTRLLVEPNRSPKHPQLFSEFTRGCNRQLKDEILQEFYQPYRGGVEDWIHQRVSSGHNVLHVSVHSFTPELNGKPRNNDLGLLYDPQRELEQKFCREWRQAINERVERDKRFQNVSGVSGGTVRTRLNYPYRGAADGFTTALRRQFAAANYCGVELEVSQHHVKHATTWRRLGELIAASLAVAIEGPKKKADG